jgi:hypothetical protein
MRQKFQSSMDKDQTISKPEKSQSLAFGDWPLGFSTERVIA